MSERTTERTTEKTTEKKKVIHRKIKLKKPLKIKENKETENKEIENKELLIQEYLEHLSDNEKQAYEIAKSHLKTSFSVERSIDFNKWMLNKK